LQATIPAGLDRKQAELYQKLDPNRLPKHIAIIMDGNGRWARRRHMPRVAGHREGVAAVRSKQPRRSASPRSLSTPSPKKTGRSVRKPKSIS